MNARHILIDGELLDVIRAVHVRGGWVNLFVGLDGTPFGCHNVPATWWDNHQAAGITTGGHLYRHAEVQQ
jgi:hypothetical protein